MSTVIGYLIIAAMAFVVVGALTRPAWALSLLLIQYPLEQLIQSYVSFFVERNEVFNVGVGLLAIFSLGGKMFSQKNPFRGSVNLISSLCILYYLLASVSLLWSPTQQDAYDVLRPGLSYVLMFVILGPLLVDRMDQLRDFLIITLIFSGAVGILVLTSPNGEFIRGRFNLRIGGVGVKESNPLAMSDLGAYLVLASVTLNVVRQSFLLLMSRIFGGIVGTGLLLAASSRGQVIAAGLVALIFYPISIRVKSLRQFILRATVFIFLIIVLFLGATLFQGQALGTEQRWDAAQLTDASAVRLQNMFTLMSEWGARPLSWALGLGSGGFAAYEKSGHEPYVHNMIIESLGEFGILGFVIFVSLMYITGVCAVRLLRMCWNDPESRAITATLVAVNVFQFLISNKQGNVWVSTQMFTTFLLMARIERNLTSDGGLEESIIESTDSEIHEHSPA